MSQDEKARINKAQRFVQNVGIAAFVQLADRWVEKMETNFGGLPTKPSPSEIMEYRRRFHLEMEKYFGVAIAQAAELFSSEELDTLNAYFGGKLPERFQDFQERLGNEFLQEFTAEARGIKKKFIMERQGRAA